MKEKTIEKKQSPLRTAFEEFQIRCIGRDKFFTVIVPYYQGIIDCINARKSLEMTKLTWSRFNHYLNGVRPVDGELRKIICEILNELLENDCRGSRGFYTTNDLFPKKTKCKK